jgi:hypothetical protein
MDANKKETLKGMVILGGVVLAVALFAVIATDNGWGKLGCIFRALAHGVSITNLKAICM